MLVTHCKLYQVSYNWSQQDCFDYSNQAEMAIATLLNMRNAKGTTGYHPGYDLICGTKKYEIKFQMCPHLFVEFQQTTTAHPSGISTTTADYWVMVNLSTDGKVGKIRKFAVEDLKVGVSNWYESQNMIVTNSAKLSSWDIPHVWLGDVSVHQGTWDLSRFVRSGRILGA